MGLSLEKPGGGGRGILTSSQLADGLLPPPPPDGKEPSWKPWVIPVASSQKKSLPFGLDSL